MNKVMKWKKNDILSYEISQLYRWKIASKVKWATVNSWQQQQQDKKDTTKQERKHINKFITICQQMKQDDTSSLYCCTDMNLHIIMLYSKTAFLFILFFHLKSFINVLAFSRSLTLIHVLNLDLYLNHWVRYSVIYFHSFQKVHFQSSHSSSHSDALIIMITTSEWSDQECQYKLFV